MAYNIETLLASRNLIGMIQRVLGGVPADLMPKGFYEPTRTVEGNRGTYFLVRGTRQTARIVQYGGPSKARELVGVSEEPVTLMHSFEHIIHSPAVLQNLVAETQSDPSAEVKQRLGLETVTRQIATFGDLYKNLRVSAIYSAFSQGAISWDASGDLLPSSTGAKYTINFQVPAANTGQIPLGPGGANIIDTAWTNPDADILVQTKNICKAARKLTGYKITHAFYGANIPEYFVSNNYFQGIIRGSQRIAEAAAITEIPDGTGGIAHWYPVSEAFFATSGQLGADETANLQDWFGPDQIVFTPDPTPDWWEVLEGTYPVPRAFTITKDSMQQIQSLEQAAGAFSYCVLIDDPVTIKHLAGDTFIPLLKVPAAIFQAQVKF